MTFLANNLGPFWQWLAEMWDKLLGGFDWALPIREFLVGFINIFRDLFTFTF